jgi:hypothetical protein
LSGAVFGAIGTSEKHGVVAVIQTAAVPVTARHGKQIRKSAIDCVQHFTTRRIQGDYGYAIGSGSDHAKTIAGNLFGTRNQA